MTDAGTPVGLYSIGIRDLAMPDLLTWAASVNIPFVHLRGGARGHSVLERSRHELERWGKTAQALCPITLVTSDVTLGELTCGDGRVRSVAQAGLHHTCESAAILGSRQVRILANAPAEATEHPIPLPDAEISLLIELHHPSWWTETGLAAAAHLTSDPRIRLMADSAQAAAGLAPHEPQDARRIAENVIALSDVLHLSDNGTGFGAPGHAVLANSARDTGAKVEVGFEWTGQPRTAEACLRRYTAACTWWHSLEAT
jgi:hypothetical protein